MAGDSEAFQSPKVRFTGSANKYTALRNLIPEPYFLNPTHRAFDVFQRAEIPDPVDTPDSLKLLLTGAIDYAGMFPPATLPLDTAIRNYAAYRRGPDAWMLGRYVCPAASLNDLMAYASLFSTEAPCSIALLATATGSGPAVTDTLVHDLSAASGLEARTGRAFIADVVEMRWPTDYTSSKDSRNVLSQIAAVLDGTPVSAVYLELPLYDSECLRRMISDIAAFNQRQTGSGTLRFGAKMRCGGTSASASPSATQIASFIALCTEYGLPFKATAGLHHPLTRYDAALRVQMHGFLNVLVASVLAREHRLALPDLVPILEENEPGTFILDTGRIGWGNLTVPADGVRQARANGIASFGSCSFDEPRDDLRSLGLL